MSLIKEFELPSGGSCQNSLNLSKIALGLLLLDSKTGNFVFVVSYGATQQKTPIPKLKAK